MELKVLNVARDLFIQKDKISEMLKDAYGNVSIYDRKVNACYHLIEFGNLNASQLAQVTKHLKLVLKERRENKQTICVCQSLLHQLNSLKKIPEVNKFNDELSKEECEKFTEMIFG